ncbi:MAG: carboxypeptidase regulatory-like domain-containing protein, partial [Myxococcales bacterium]
MTSTGEGGCVSGACTPCMPGERGCDDLDATLCSAAGAWGVGETCAAACLEGICVECAPGARDCGGVGLESDDRPRPIFSCRPIKAILRVPLEVGEVARPSLFGSLMSISRLLLLGVLAILTACDANPPRQNPYDPEAPSHLQAKARITGRVICEGATALAGARVVATEEEGQQSSLPPVETLDDGSFAVLEVPPGKYRLTVSLAGYAEATVRDIRLGPGERRELGAISLEVLRGVLEGTVTLADGESPAGTVVSLSPSNNPNALPVTVLAGADGRWAVANLPAADYMVRAEREAYAPAYLPAPHPVVAGAPSDEIDLRLHPASAIVRFHKDGELVRYTNTREVGVELLQFVSFLRDMRLSEDPTFADPSWDVEWRDFSVKADFTLAPVEGERVVWAQFRDSLGNESQAFLGRVVYDATAPVVSFTINEGRPFLTDPAGRATLALTGFDEHAGVSAWRYASTSETSEALSDEDFLAGAFGDQPFEPIDSVAATVTAVRTIELGPEEGPRRVLVQLRDRAGNVGTSALARLYRDSTPPALGTPAIEVLGGSPARSLDVQLRLDAVGREGEQLFVAVANAPGLDANSRFVPLANPFAHRLAEGEDAMARQVCAIFKDEAGLLTEQQCLAVTVDRSGSFRGTVRLEDPTEPADGTLVSLLRLDPSSGGYLETGMGDLTGPEGGYQLTGLAPATYRLRFSRTGYRSRDLDDLVLGEGREERLAEQTLQFARGRLEGSATLGGETNHDGVRVEILGQSAFTDSTGAFSFANLRAGTWELVARRAPAFQPATTSVVIVEAQTAGASLTLAPVPSTLRGVARLAGSAVHSGIGVLVTGVTVAGSERSASTTTDEQGAFSLTGLTAGSYRVRLTASGYREVDEAIGVVLLGAGEDKQLGTWTLEPASGAIAGTVQLSDSSNHEGVRLSLQRDGREAQTTFSDQRGQFRLDPVPVGTYSLVAARGGYTRVTLTPVIVLAEQTTTVGPLTLTPQVGNVWLEDAAGAPLGSATSQTSIRVRGSYPNAAEARICERPGAAGPEDFVPDDCPWTGLVGGETETWEPVPHDFAPSECVGATSAVCDGAKVVFVQVRDAAGIESEWFSLPVILDRQPPRGIIVIQPDAATLDGGQIANGGARFTRSSVVRVAVLAVEDRLQVLEPDEVSGIARARIYRFREDTAPLLVDLREGGTVLDGVTLASLDGEDGPRELFVIVEDFAGNTSVPSLDSVSCPDALGDQLPEACDSIFLDTTPPSSVGFSINPPTNDYSTSADWALSHAVELGIDTGGTGREEDFGVEATLSNDPTFARAIVTPLELPRSIVDWNLASGEGTRRVYLRVRDEAGNLSDVYSAEIGVDTRDPDPPLLLAVGAVTGQSAPTLSFTSVEGASRYRLQLVRREGASFVTVLDDDTLGTTSFVPSPLADGSYLWRVKAIKPSGRESPFSANDAFVVDTLPPQAPLLAALPSDPTNLATPAVTWSEIEDAASYTVQWAKTSGFTGAHFGSAESVSPAYTLPLDDDGVWYWRVRARDAAGNLSAWSAAGSFERDTAPPANPPLLAPADEAFVPSRAISLSWEPVADAAAYFVDTSQLPTLASFERVESTFTSRGVTVSADGDWYWRVLARDAAGNLSPVDSAPIRKVRVDTVAPETPALVAVATPTANNRPTLSWSAVADAAGYLLTLDGTAIPVAGTSHTPDPLDDGSHTWTVAARDAAGNRSPDAPAQSFVVDTLAPAVPTLFAIAPDPTNLASPVASWTAASDAVSYEISWERTSSADPGAVTVASTSYPLSLGSDGEWRWRARAIDAVGNASAWSAWDVFTRDTIAPAVSSVALSGGAFTASPTVSVLSTVTGADALLVSGDVSRINVGAGVPRGTWVAYSDSLSIDLTSGDGLK